MKKNLPILLLAISCLVSACSNSTNNDSSSINSSSGSNSDSTNSISYDYSQSDLFPDEGGERQEDDGRYDPRYQSGYTKVDSAPTYLDLPVFKNTDPNYWQTASTYKGNRTDFRDESIYFVITTRFYDGDLTNNDPCWDGSKNASDDPAWRGDFKGLIEKMDYIKALGFTSIWITPVTKNASGYDYHGYHTINFKKVDKRYESEDVAFIDVIRAAHARDMKIILDVVFNHTCNFGEENLYPMFLKKENDNTFNAMVKQNNGLLPNNYDSLNGGQQWSARVDSVHSDTTDKDQIYHNETVRGVWNSIEVQTEMMADDCLDLNTENPTVANYLVEAYGEFIRMGVDAFRIDTLKHINRLTMNKYYYPAFKEFATRCGNPNFHMFGEVCARYRQIWNEEVPPISCPYYGWKENGSYSWGDTATNMASTVKVWNDTNNKSNQRTSNNERLNDNNTYHTPDYSQSNGTSVIDFPMHWNFENANGAFNIAKDNDQYYNDASYNVVYVDSHDYGPDSNVRYNGGTEAWKENMSLMFTFRGVPCIYYGSEIEFKKNCTIDNGPNTPLVNTGRAYFGEHLQGSVNVTDFGKFTSASGAMNTTLNSTLSKHLQMLNKIRLLVPALRRGQYKTYGDLKFVRRYTVGSVDSLAVVSITNGGSFSGLPNGTYVDLVSGDRKTVSGGTLNTSVSGKGNLSVYVLENSSTGTLGKVN